MRDMVGGRGQANFTPQEHRICRVIHCLSKPTCTLSPLPLHYFYPRPFSLCFSVFSDLLLFRSSPYIYCVSLISSFFIFSSFPLCLPFFSAFSALLFPSSLISFFFHLRPPSNSSLFPCLLSHSLSSFLSLFLSFLFLIPQILSISPRS